MGSSNSGGGNVLGNVGNGGALGQNLNNRKGHGGHGNKHGHKPANMTLVSTVDCDSSPSTKIRTVEDSSSSSSS